ncbi:hypothetical protein C0995_003450 [Termitomyces sp. Mi166|nr:hypothetical protein C0995_003450 [Termitomyces sp. Mi166\
MLYLGREEPLPYQSPYYSGGFGEGAAYGPQTGYREVDNEEHYGCPVQQHTYVSVVMQPALPPRLARQKHAPYMQPVNEVLLQCLEQAGQPVSATAAFLQDSLAVIVIEGLLDQIEMMKRQRVTVLEHIEHAGKHKAPAYEEPVVELKWARALFTVVVLTTDPRTLEQYDGLVATQQKTAAASKSKGKAVATIKSESDYGQFLSEDEQESEEGKSAAQHFQRVQQNKKLTMKKANVVKAEAAQQHRAINDFSSCIPDRLGVKVNTVHAGTNANWAAAFEFNSHQQAKVPTTIVYKYTPCSLPRTPYELEWLYKYSANEHVPQHDRVVAYMLISELLLFTQWLDDNLHDHTMQVHVPDDQAYNFLDDDTLCVLLHNRILLDWVDHAYTYGMVYLEQQFHSPTMSLDIFREVNNERIKRLSHYSTPPAILQWDG